MRSSWKRGVALVAVPMAGLALVAAPAGAVPWQSGPLMHAPLESLFIPETVSNSQSTATLNLTAEERELLNSGAPATLYMEVGTGKLLSVVPGADF
ncbi:hypothetical protein GCM10027417_19300 [Glutamicibacter endophyticus]